MIRALRPSDRLAWNPLWYGYLGFYGAVLPEGQAQLTWDRLHDSASPMEGLVAEQNGAVIGLAHIQLRPSSWSEHGYLYLEDLYVDPSVRGQGVASRLIEAVYTEARAKKANRVYWMTESDNPARKLYDRYANESGYVQYRHAVEISA